MTRPKQIRYDPSNDLYTVLGVASNASTDDIQRAFRQRAKAVHPDLNRDRLTWAHEEFQRINNAYDLLSNPESRTEYDQKRLVNKKPKDPNKPSEYTTVSRAVWAKRHRRRRPGSALFFASLLLMSSCWIAGTVSQRVRREQQLTLSAPAVVMMIASPTASHACDREHSMITDPTPDTSVPSSFSIKGTARDSDFDYYEVEMQSVGDTATQSASNPSPTRIVRQGYRQVDNGLLVAGTGGEQMIPGSYVLRLTVHRSDGSVLPSCEIQIRVFALPTPSPGLF
jgi:hypothetical protein